MRIGFLTNCLRGQPAEEIVDWAVSEGFEFLEVGPGVAETPEELAAIQERLPIVALIFCRNFLTQDPAERNRLIAGLEGRLEAAAALGLPFVTTATGFDESLPLSWNLRAFAGLFKPWLACAEQAGVAICLENCPSTGNFAVSPHTWELAFEAVQSDALKLCFDPSHLVKLFIDVYEAAEAFADRIGYVHVKDCALFPEVLGTKGIWRNNEYWQHRIPTEGEIQWASLLGVLRGAGFDGDLSIEHEDPRYEGSPEKVREALLRSRDAIAMGL